MKLGRPKKHQIRYADDDWYRVVTKSPLSKDTVTFLERQIKRNDNSEKKLIQPSEQLPEVTDVPMSKIFKSTDGKWQYIGVRCNECNKTLSDENVISKHKFFCPRINTLSKETEDMPVQQIKVDGKVMYRWGDHGKAYPTKQEAERQGRAAYAAGYKGKQENK